MRVLIVMVVDYPLGSAAANRMQKFARGLSEAGAQPMVLAACPSSSAEETNGALEWKTDNFGIRYAQARWCSAGGILPFYTRRVMRLRPILRSAVSQVVDESAPDVVIIYGQSAGIFQPIRRYCQQRGIIVVMDVTEYHPPTLKRTLMMQSTDQWFCMRQLLAKLDGTIAISRWLEDFVKAQGCPVIRVPVLSEGAENPIPARHGDRRFTITYVGQMIDRDLPDSMLDGLLAAVDKGLDASLVVIGRVDSRPSGRACQRRIQSDPRLRERVTVTGWVSDEELSSRLTESDCFVLLRDDEVQTLACFPTRLPDYLQTGKPVILSGVGDLDQYFEHRENAWVLPPGKQPELLADAMIHLHKYPTEAAEIGLSGMQTCAEQFSYRRHGLRIAEFLMELVSREMSPLGDMVSTE